MQMKILFGGRNNCILDHVTYLHSNPLHYLYTP